MKKTQFAVPTAAVCLTLLFAGCTSDAADTEPDATPSTAPGGTAAPTVTGVFAGSNPTVKITYTLPDGWAPGGSTYIVDAGDAVMHFWTVGNVYADGCRWTLQDPPLGPTVDDLATAWGELPGFTATTPVAVTVDGYAGKRVAYTVPDYDAADCLGEKFGLVIEDNRTGSSPDWWAQVPEQQNRQWILDVDGTRLVINEWSKPGTTPEQLADMDEFLASVQIESTS